MAGEGGAVVVEAEVVVADKGRSRESKATCVMTEKHGTMI